MKSLLLVALTLLVGALSAQVKDTMDKTFRDGKLNSFVYIDKSKNSPIYKKIEARSFSPLLIRKSLDSLKRTFKTDLPKVEIKGIPTKWIRLTKYKGKFYLYAPCDWCSHGYLTLQDGLMDFYACESIILQIASFNKTGDRSYSIHTKGGKNLDLKHKLYIIDKEKGIAVFDFETPLRERWPRLMVDAAKMRQFPIIVHQCKNKAPSEFPGLDEINYKKLIAAGK